MMVIKNTCKACDGTALNSKGDPCPICKLPPDGATFEGKDELDQLFADKQNLSKFSRPQFDIGETSTYSWGDA